MSDSERRLRARINEIADQLCQAIYKEREKMQAKSTEENSGQSLVEERGALLLQDDDGTKVQELSTGAT